jgi:hypothetical protein
MPATLKKKKRVSLTDDEIKEMIDAIPTLRNKRAGTVWVIYDILERAGIEDLPKWYVMDRKTANQVLKDLGLW